MEEVVEQAVSDFVLSLLGACDVVEQAHSYKNAGHAFIDVECYDPTDGPQTKNSRFISSSLMI